MRPFRVACVAGTLLGAAIALAGDPPISIRVIAQEDEPTPLPGVNYWAFTAPVIAETGEIACLVFLRGDAVVSATNTAVIFIDRDGQTSIVAREGSPAPGTATEFDTFSGVSISADGGTIAFSAGLEGVPGVTVWTGPPDDIAMLTQTGAPVDGLPGATFTQFDLSATNFTEFPMIDDDGDLLTTCRITGPGSENGQDEGYWSTRDGVFAPILQSGQDAPGTDGLFDDFFDTDARPAHNGRGRIAFRGKHAPGEHGIWTDRTGTLELLASNEPPSRSANRTRRMSSSVTRPPSATATSWSGAA